MGHIRKKERAASACSTQLRAAHGRATESTEDVATQICEDLAELRQLRISRVARVELRAHRLRDGVSQGALPGGVLLGMLNAWPMGFYPPSTLIHDARRHGVEVRPPCLRDGAAGVHRRGDGRCRRARRCAWDGGTSAASARKCSRRSRRRGRPDRSTSIERRRAPRGAPARRRAAPGARRAPSPRWEPDRRRAAWEGAARCVGDVLPLAPMPRTPVTSRARSIAERARSSSTIAPRARASAATRWSTCATACVRRGALDSADLHEAGGTARHRWSAGW